MKWLIGLAAAGLALLGLKSASDKPSSSPSPDPKPGGGGGSGGKGDPYAPPWNPPAPGKPLIQSEVTPAMQSWAIEVLGLSPPIHTEVYRVFPEGEVIARVEWHTKQARTGKEGLFKGVSLYWSQNYLT